MKAVYIIVMHNYIVVPVCQKINPFPLPERFMTIYSYLLQNEADIDERTNNSDFK